MWTGYLECRIDFVSRLRPCFRRKYTGIAAIIALLALPACGKGLSGTYVKCVSVNAAASNLATYVFPDSSNFTYQVVPYTAANCLGMAGTSSASAGTYVEASSSVPDAQDITFSFGSGSLNGKTLYQIYKLDGNQLYLGDTSGANDGSSDARRPTSFETTSYAKQ